jgi:hypothetical protein
MKQNFAKLWILFALFSFNTNAVEKENINGINQQIDALISVFTDGVAVSYPEFRLVKYGNIFEGKSDAVAFFGIEGFGGSNVHFEYIAFFSEVSNTVLQKNHKKYQLIAVKKIGGRGWRTFDWKNAKIKGRSVEVLVTSYKDSDPMCCPSLHGNATFIPNLKGEIYEKLSFPGSLGAN